MLKESIFKDLTINFTNLVLNGIRVSRTLRACQETTVIHVGGDV